MFSTDSVHLDVQVAQDTNDGHILHGQVLMPNTAIDQLIGMELHLLNQEDVSQVRMGLTDRLGRFTFTNVLPGNYALQVIGEESDVVMEPVIVAA